ncbi:MAG: YciI family protein [Pseudomonadota bacterium]
MPSFSEYKKTARERGALAYEVYMVTSRPLVDPETFAEHLPDHLAYLASHEHEGRLMMAGPLSDETGEEMSGMGFQIWRAQSWEDARALADGDPMHLSGVKSYEMRRWLINEGSFNLTVGLSSGGLSLG